jgi:hypothetical protein
MLLVRNFASARANQAAGSEIQNVGRVSLLGWVGGTYYYTPRQNVGTIHHQELKDSKKLNISVGKPFSLSDNSYNNGFFHQLIIVHIGNFR